MEAAGLVLSAAQTLLTAAQCPQLKELFSVFGYKSELESLESSVSAIRSVLLVAEAKEALSHQERDLVEKLKDAVYDADDLLDEFATVARRQQQLAKEGGSSAGVSNKVRRLFARFDRLGFARKMSREVKMIRKRLDGIASDASKFSFKLDHQPIRRRREETSSYVCREEVVGRENDLRKIKERLLDPDVEKDVSFLTIVGVGGLGKTTLAGLVYNDGRIDKEFSSRLWACVADQGQDRLDVKAVAGAVLKSAIDEGDVDRLSTEQLQRRLRERLGGNKCLLVLDDVWTENRGDWLKLMVFLTSGLGRGSRIVVTTRSERTAIAVGSDFTYKLEGLSEEDSWRLFERTAGEEQANHQDFVEIGRAIVRKCANVPLAIKVLGTLLYGQERNKWRSFERSGLNAIRKSDNDIMPILKFSYHHLSTSLKSCFSYCAVFPKDYVIEKEVLVSLWLAQGYIEPLDGGQSIEDAAEEHFSILLKRCFFQDVIKDKYGEIESCKIHDLLHDVALEVAGEEICWGSTPSSTLNTRTRHVSNPIDCLRKIFASTNVRTYFHYGHMISNGEVLFPVGVLMANWTSLRALDLHYLGIQIVPVAIGKLLHLRYLDLSSNNKLEVLPKSITKLCILQTLNLTYCNSLKELPNDLCNLVNLRLLDLDGCSKLTHMPPGLDKLTCLCRLPLFVVGARELSLKQRQRVGEIKDISALKNLRGHLKIRIKQEYTPAREQGEEGGEHLRSLEYLASLCIMWEHNEGGGRVDHEEALLEDLQPPHNLRVLKLKGYRGGRIPRWAGQDNLAAFFPKLAEISLYRCLELKALPSMSELCHLKSLKIRDSPKLEHMEDTTCTQQGAAEQPLFFPSLEKLHLFELPKLRGWWRESRAGSGESGLTLTDGSSISSRLFWSFSRLSKLCILKCPNLTSLPLCPVVKRLALQGFNPRLQAIVIDDKKQRKKDTGSSPSESDCSSHPGITSINTDNVGYLKSLPMGAFSRLNHLEISGDREIECLSEVEEVFDSCSSSLRFLDIGRCSKLRSVSVVLGRLHMLESLHLSRLPALAAFPEGEDKEGHEEDGMPWRSFRHSLHILCLVSLPRAVGLPKWISHLTSLETLRMDCPRQGLPEWIGCLSSLRTLHVCKCGELESLPEAMPKLTSLRSLYLQQCSSGLKRRCQENPQGEDWPKIQHIRHVDID